MAFPTMRQPILRVAQSALNVGEGVRATVGDVAEQVAPMVKNPSLDARRGISAVQRAPT